jgi:cytochrome c-type biogenesis protein CcmF
LMKDNNMSSNPDTRAYFSKDVFTYISYALNDKGKEDTSSFRITEAAEGDTIYYSKGYMILNSVVKNPVQNKFNMVSNGAMLMADITIYGKDSMRYKGTPIIQVEQSNVVQVDDTVYAQNLYLKFVGVAEGRKVKIGVKESDKLIDYIALKAYIFPYINLVWIGLVVMAIGMMMSMIRRLQLSAWYAFVALAVAAIALFYMFLFAN